jgi:flagellum-specific peptidoglycan hydrolase FlgJ
MTLRPARRTAFALPLVAGLLAAVPAGAAGPTGPGGTALEGPAAGSPPTWTPQERAAAVRQASGGVGSGGTTTTPSTGSGTSSSRTVTASRPSSRATIKLQSSKRVTVRRTPTDRKRMGTLRNGASIRVLCQMNGPPQSGYSGRSRVWDRVRLPNGRAGYVPDAMVQGEKASMVARYCGWSEPGAPGAENPQQGRCSSVATVPLVSPPANRAAFIATAGPLARASAATTKVPASVTLAQGILESASGTLTAGANNYFGIKAQAVDAKNGVYRWGTEAVGCVLKPTFESESGRLVRQLAAFRMYRGMQDSFDDHGLFLLQNSRYANAFKYSDDPERFAKEIHKAGYATDPQYSSSLIRLMRSEKLTQYDR